MATETARFPKETLEILARPMPKEALSQAPRGLTSIKSIYITERLNEAFGMGRWDARDTVVAENYPMVVVKVELSLEDYPWFRRTAYGGNNNADLGDAYKGAVSDAISKICAVYLGVASEVYRGHAMEQGVRPADVQRKSANGNGNSYAPFAAECGDDDPLFDENGDLVPAIQREPAVKSIDATGQAAISEKQAKRFFAVAMAHGKTNDQMKNYLASVGLSDIKFCPWGDVYRAAIAWAETR